jgi:hypothetical protein
MGITLTTQARLPPTTGTTHTEDGAPMHAYIPHGMARSLNNLASYVCPFVQFAYDHDSGAYGSPGRSTTIDTTHTVSRECFVAQMPIMVPPQPKRMLWTVGLRCNGSGGLATHVTAATVYLASSPYVGAAAGSAFDTTNGGRWTTGSYLSDTEAIAAFDPVSATYRLVDASATGLTPMSGVSFLDHDNGAYVTNLVVTLTGYSEATVTATWLVDEFTCWFKWE